MYNQNQPVSSPRIAGIVIPHVIDQFYWGMRVNESGAGSKYISRGQLSAAKLSAAIRQALTDESMRACADQLGRAIGAELDGVSRAVRAIEARFG